MLVKLPSHFSCRGLQHLEVPAVSILSLWEAPQRDKERQRPAAWATLQMTTTWLDMLDYPGHKDSNSLIAQSQPNLSAWILQFLFMHCQARSCGRTRVLDVLEWVPCRLPRQTKGWVIPSSGTISDISRSFVLKAASETCMNVVRKQKASKLSERMLLILAPISELLHVPDFMPRCTRVLARSSQVSWVSYAFICFSSVQAPFLVSTCRDLLSYSPLFGKSATNKNRHGLDDKRKKKIKRTPPPPLIAWRCLPRASSCHHSVTAVGSCSSTAIESWWMKPAHDFCHGWKWDCFHLFEIAVPLIHYINVST